ncbi:uncharacterized protein LOC126892001 [Diabrotica virgifera virgifera]|uniref:SWIM-type domain-containing protein n=1 Tax=Diabrotica virgifera virgifera TaxID=50390 RepID=A0ABM5JHS4_DIAVI|nr:uncharacterized protein LOC126878679 [Diabrotica virgifera virgifera]XP_050517359.1 uncharacterized protein LOC126892001 [Diabrotica virgifera virgifera]
MARLRLVEYLEYLGGTNTSRSVCEGEEVLNAGHVILCGKSNSSTSDKILIYALCLQTSALTSDPHKIRGELLQCNSEKGTIKIKSMFCSCKAGASGRCKHISAVLLNCTRVNLEELEVISQTDVKCVWSTQKHVTQEKYKPVPIKDMPCFKNKIEQCRLELDTNKLHNFFMGQLPQSALSKHNIGRREVADIIVDKKVGSDINNYYIQAILDNACQSIAMLEASIISICNENDCCKVLFSKLFNMTSDTIININQQSKEWHEQRKYRVTGSRIYELYTYSKSEWDNKATRYFYSKGFSNKFTKHGVKYEGDAKDAFVSQTSLQVVDCGMIVSHSNPWLGYSPDGVIFENNRPVALLEVKCLYQGATKNIKEVLSTTKFIEKIGNTYVLKRNHKYYGQVQLGMALLNVPTCYFGLYASFDKSMEIFKIEFNYTFSKQMLTVVKKNFFENMLHVVCKSNKL